MTEHFEMPPNLAYVDVPLNHADGTVHLRVERNGQDWERRTVYYYSITGSGLDHRKYDDLRTGVGMDPGPGEMLATLLSFLTACAESISYLPGGGGENANLFPRDVAEWAAQHSDELAMLRFEIEEGDVDE